MVQFVSCNVGGCLIPQTLNPLCLERKWPGHRGDTIRKGKQGGAVGLRRCWLCLDRRRIDNNRSNHPVIDHDVRQTEPFPTGENEMRQ
jgi:hypothetical protein